MPVDPVSTQSAYDAREALIIPMARAVGNVPMMQSRNQAEAALDAAFQATWDRPCETCEGLGRDIGGGTYCEQCNDHHDVPCAACGGSGSLPVAAVVHALSDSQLREAVERAKEAGILVRELDAPGSVWEKDTVQRPTTAEDDAPLIVSRIKTPRYVYRVVGPEEKP